MLVQLVQVVYDGSQIGLQGLRARARLAHLVQVVVANQRCQMRNIFECEHVQRGKIAQIDVFAKQFGIEIDEQIATFLLQTSEVDGYFVKVNRVLVVQAVYDPCGQSLLNQLVVVAGGGGG